jgi:hypothetical protein
VEGQTGFRHLPPYQTAKNVVAIYGWLFLDVRDSLGRYRCWDKKRISMFMSFNIFLKPETRNSIKNHDRLLQNGDESF